MSTFVRPTRRFSGCRTFTLTLGATVFVYLLSADATGLRAWLGSALSSRGAGLLKVVAMIGFAHWIRDDTAQHRPYWTGVPMMAVCVAALAITLNDWWLLGTWPAAAKLAMVPVLLVVWLVPWLEADRRWLRGSDVRSVPSRCCAT